MSEELKPCPKCNNSEISFSAEYCKHDCRYLYISCVKCSFRLDEGEHYEFDDEGYSSKIEAKSKLIQTWNKRA